MSEKTDLNISPYYDDYTEDTNYHKVLYRAGRPLQARELTQSQSILQNQVQKFGNHFFKEGSIVNGAQTDIDMDVEYVKVDATNPNTSGTTDVTTYLSSSVGKLYKGETSGVIGEVVTTVAQTTTEPDTLIVKYLQQGTDGTATANPSQRFSASEEISEVTLNASGVSSSASNNNEFKVKQSGDTPVGRASIAKIAEGVVFVRGFFVKVSPQTVVLEKYNGKPSYRIGLDITEQLITSSTDTSLLDNAQGTTNENAPGADRLKFTLTFNKYSLTDTTDTNFVELGRVNQGVIELETTKPMYSHIENTLAERTFDANGDFVMKQFTHSFREHLNDGSFNRGFYEAYQGGKEEQFVMQISPGKAYVKGYSIDKTGTTNLNFNKARTTATLSNANTPARLGNKLRINDAHGYPEFGDSTATSSYNPIHIFDTAPTTNGTLEVYESANSVGHIGYARVRNIDEHSSTYDNLYLFDIKMFTMINIAVTSGNFKTGDKVTGSVSGATGIVASTKAADGTVSTHENASANFVMLHDVVGTFTTNDQLSIEGQGTYSSSNTITSIRTFQMEDARGVGQIKSSETGATENFTANVATDHDKLISGLATIAANGAITGVGTRFLTELRKGDIIFDGAGAAQIVTTITDNATAQTVATSSVGTATLVNLLRRRAKLYNQDQSASIFAWPRDKVSANTPTANTVRYQKEFTVSASGTITLTKESGESFGAVNNDNYQFAVVKQSTNGSRTRNNGVVLQGDDLSSLNNTSGVCTIGNANDQGAIVRASYTVTITNPIKKSKELRESRAVKYSKNNAHGDNPRYGTAYDNKELSLGVSDVYAIRGIYEGIPGGLTNSSPTPPNAVINESSGTPATGNVIKGQTSGVRAKLIDYNGDDTTSYFYYLGDSKFTAGETIVDETSGAIATLTSIGSNSPEITNRYYLDNGQRDGYYDHAKLVLKQGQTTPNNQILVIFDYFTGGSGDFYDVSSYTDAGIKYKDIPNFSPNKVDIGGFEPDGQFELADAVDYRPSVGQLFGNANFGSNSYVYDQTAILDLSDYGTNGNGAGILISPFAYEARSFEAIRENIDTNFDDSVDTSADISSAKPSYSRCPLPTSMTKGNISFYVPRIDKVFLHRSGEWVVSPGNPGITPQKPNIVDDALEMFELFIPPFTQDLKNIRVKSKDYRRFTMGDIGRINQRVTTLERLTALSLLEKDTQTKQILDADGFDRFKSGFLVDNFRGHKIGDVTHEDYNVAIDTKLGQLRPKGYSQFFDIELNTSYSTGYQKTGDLITLPYTQIEYAKNDKASRALNVNPYHVFAFIGNIKLTPESDIWNDTEQLPEVRINREGNYDAVLAENENSLGTVWNAWQTTWVGEPVVVDSEVLSSSGGSWQGDPAQGGTWQEGQDIVREITETPETQTRTGVKTSVVEEFVETRNDRIVSVTVVPFIRSREIKIEGTNLKPLTNHYVYFDGIRVDQYVRPDSATYSSDGSTTTVAATIKTDGNGKLICHFNIPNDQYQRFPTGQREVRLTSDATNIPNPDSYASSIYQAQGLLQSSQTEVVSTRNGRIVLERLTGERSISRQGERLNVVGDGSLPPPPPVAPPQPIAPPPPPPKATLPIQVPPPAPSPTPVPAPVPAPAPEPTPAPAPPPELPPLEDPIQPGDDFELFDGPRRWRKGEPMRWDDPLAESFLIESDGGAFITSIDVYFKTKSDSMPVSVEIRNMVNGYPGQQVYPFSVVTKNPADVNTSTDGATATTFTFESPVYLEDGKEYCFVVYTNSTDYECFISRMGETDLITGQTISGQPYAGSLFLSQNASTWTAEQTDDLKFTIRAAKFTTDAYANVVFENAHLPESRLQNNSIETVSGSSKVRVYSYSHGLYDDDSNVVIWGVEGDKEDAALTITVGSTTGTPAAATYSNLDLATTSSATGGGLTVGGYTVNGSNVVTAITISNPGYGYTVGETITVTGLNNSSSCTFTVASIGDTLGGIPVGAINQAFSAISDYDIDSFAVTPDLTSYGLDYSNAIESTLGGGDASYMTKNLYYDVLHTMIPSLTYKDCTLYSSVRRTGTNSPQKPTTDNTEGQALDTTYTLRSDSDFITLNDNQYFDKPSIVASSINETQELTGGNTNKSFECRLQFFTKNQNLSPVIDVGTIGCIGIMNRINNVDSSSNTPVTYIPSTEPDGDNNAMVYMTRKVNLKNPATSLKVIADNFRPPETDLKFMYKLIKNDETVPVDDLGWEYFNTTGIDDSSIEQDGRNFKEYEYTADGLPEFTGFAVKVVGQSYNTCVAPIVTSLRCIALA